MTPENNLNEEFQSRKEKIITTAFELFAKQGYSNTTIRQIAQKANVSLALITFHFKTKEALYNEVREIIFNFLDISFSEVYEKTMASIQNKISKKELWSYVDKYLSILIKCSFLEEIYNYQLLIVRETTLSEDEITSLIPEFIYKMIENPLSLLILNILDSDDELWARTIIKATCGSIRCFIEEDKMIPYIMKGHSPEVANEKIQEYLFSFTSVSLRNAVKLYKLNSKIS